MGLFSRSKSKQTPTVGGGVNTQKIQEFCVEVMKSYADDGVIDNYEVDTLRRLANKLDLTKQEIATSKLLITKLVIDAGEKVGMTKEQATKMASQVLIQMLKI